jgi:hypothetical protein
VGVGGGGAIFGHTREDGGNSHFIFGSTVHVKIQTFMIILIFFSFVREQQGALSSLNLERRKHKSPLSIKKLLKTKVENQKQF